MLSQSPYPSQTQVLAESIFSGIQKEETTLADPRGGPHGAPTRGSQFFCSHIKFFRTPREVAPPPTVNPGSATDELKLLIPLQLQKEQT